METQPEHRLVRKRFFCNLDLLFTATGLHKIKAPVSDLYNGGSENPPGLVITVRLVHHNAILSNVQTLEETFKRLDALVAFLTPKTVQEAKRKEKWNI